MSSAEIWRASPARRGSILVMALWTVVILGAMTIAIAKHLTLDVRITKFRLARERARVLAHSGVLMAVWRLGQDVNDRVIIAAAEHVEPDWLGDPSWTFIGDTGEPGAWVVPIDPEAEDEGGQAAYVSIRITDEERKLDLNRVEDPETYAMFSLLLGSPEQVDRIADYIDAENVQERVPGGERIDGNPLYQAKNGPLATLAELSTIPGLHPETLATLQRTATVHLAATPGKPNINTADIDVLRVGPLAGYADSIIGFREQGHFFIDMAATPPLSDTGDATVAAPWAGEPDFLAQIAKFDEISNTFTIVSEGVVAQPPVKFQVEAVVKRADCGENIPTPCIVAWKEL